ncbi:MAG: heavy-metal-associated domain-containing protein [Anaerolineae bacterium]|nr:heavy-metal-associated domain-containing protein [Anaerolineae bacterium]
MSEHVTLNVTGMSCNHCVMRVEKALKGVLGVSEVAVSLEAGQATVGYDPAKAALDDFKAAVADAGYEVV